MTRSRSAAQVALKADGEFMLVMETDQPVFHK